MVLVLQLALRGNWSTAESYQMSAGWVMRRIEAALRDRIRDGEDRTWEDLQELTIGYGSNVQLLRPRRDIDKKQMEIPVIHQPMLRHLIVRWKQFISAGRFDEESVQAFLRKVSSTLHYHLNPARTPPPSK